jgi:hypothetical protein
MFLLEYIVPHKKTVEEITILMNWTVYLVFRKNIVILKLRMQKN